MCVAPGASDDGEYRYVIERMGGGQRPAVSVARSGDDRDAWLVAADESFVELAFTR